MRKSLTFPIILVASVAVLAPVGSLAVAAQRQPQHDQPAVSRVERIEPYQARFGRARPVVAVLGENGGTELTDFVIPYGILAQSGVADVVSVGIRPGVLTMRPALHIQPDATAAQFDVQFPKGADYVIVPAMVKRNDPAILAWLSRQSGQGATIVSICDGALVVANAGLLKGHRATAHWATLSYRRKTYPDVHWVENSRYVADGAVVSSAGISAAIPTSLALVEAIGGHDKAVEAGRRVGATEWRSAHNSQVFGPKLGRNLSAYATTNYFNHWLHRQEAIGVAVAPGVDEIAVALTADAYTRSGRGKAYAIAGSLRPVVTSHGLVIVPDRPNGAGVTDRMVTLPQADHGAMIDRVLASVARDYGRSTAFGVALDFEYPGFHD
jgi:putative intracellular protease/amidase